LVKEMLSVVKKPRRRDWKALGPALLAATLEQPLGVGEPVGTPDATLRRTADFGLRRSTFRGGEPRHFFEENVGWTAFGNDTVHTRHERFGHLPGKAGEQKDGNLRVPATELFGNLAAVHSGHLKIKNDEVNPLLADDLQPGRAILCGEDAEVS